MTILAGVCRGLKPPILILATGLCCPCPAPPRAVKPNPEVPGAEAEAASLSDRGVAGEWAWALGWVFGLGVGRERPRMGIVEEVSSPLLLVLGILLTMVGLCRRGGGWRALRPECRRPETLGGWGMDCSREEGENEAVIGRGSAGV